ncbi:MAG: FliM/FliN family flagellar motor switch protein [Phycisphaerales bacterium]|nr:FliM/FliN family flagellar motor switch protein [Phycisphaerales bacterium]
MAEEVRTLEKLEVPVIVRLGRRRMPVESVLALAPGSIIELPKNADEELELLINNKHSGYGVAVKVGENFGIRITFLGDVSARLAAVASRHVDRATRSDDDLAESLLAGQL